MASLARCIVRRTPLAPLSVRTISNSSIAQKDLVKDLYLREIKSYKPTPPAKDAHVGAVKTYSTPSAPQPPSLPEDLAGELAAYDKAEPGATGSTVKATSGHEQGPSSSGAKEFLDFLEADHPKAEAHH